jgi:hypothetical protein
MIDTLWHIAPVVVAIALGYFAGFVTAAVLAVSSETSRWHDTADAPHDDSAEVAALKAELALAQADLAYERNNVKFHYDMATERM